MAVLAFLASADAWADSRAVTALNPSLPQPGTAFEDASKMTLAQGQRLICDSDTDKPKLAKPALMEIQGGRGSDRVRRCSVFAPGSDGGGWVQGMVPSLAGPARLWMTFVEQGGGGRLRLAQLSLWAKRDGWDKVAKSMADIQGASPTASERFLNWQDDQYETTMFADEKNSEEFAIAISDIRLRRLLKYPGTFSRPE
jgi:hypothetical protein